jgi:hypothetical protein|tara:strand:- start:11886 stop:12110 length:225 start_codon:yes stop_codon:yes gene_type:complete
MKKLDLNAEKAWVTFSENDEFESVWQPVMMNGKQLNWDSHFIMEIARERWGETKSFGIAPTSQMLMRNAVRDNF